MLSSDMVEISIKIPMLSYLRLIIGTVFDREINNEGDLNHIKALVPSLLEYQPDLAVNTIASAC